MTLAHESYCVTAPLAHGTWRKNTCGPEDEPLQSLTAWGDAVLTKHAPSNVLPIGKASELTIVNQ